MVLATLAARLSFAGPPFSFSESLVWLFVGVVPAAVLFSMIRDASSPSIAQVLYDVEHHVDTKTHGRDRP
jgi:hypothetical protein